MQSEQLVRQPWLMNCLEKVAAHIAWQSEQTTTFRDIGEYTHTYFGFYSDLSFGGYVSRALLRKTPHKKGGRQFLLRGY